MKRRTKDIIAFCLIEGMLLYGLTVMGTHIGSEWYKGESSFRSLMYHRHNRLEDKQTAEKYWKTSKKLRNISDALNPFAYKH